MYTRILVWSLFLLTLLGDKSYSQPSDLGYPPPPGWEYVRNLDTTDIQIFAHNDSVLFQTKIPSTGFWKLERSTDGGKTFQQSILPPGVGSVEQVPNTPLLWTYVIKDTIGTLVVSEDLGQTYQDRARMNDLIPDFQELTPTGHFGNFLRSNPHNPRNNWFLFFSQVPFQGVNFEQLYMTTDGGYSWEQINVPLPSNHSIATVIYLDIRFDHRDPSSWYFISQGIYKPHTPPYDTVTEYYVSRDRGQTFTQIPIVSKIIGVTDTGEHFFWTGPKKDYYTGYKVYDSLGIEKQVGLFEKILPYKLPIDSLKSNGCSIDPDRSVIFSYDPTQMLINVAERKFDKDKDTVYFDSTWLFYTKDGISFEQIFRSPSRGRALYTYNDPIQGTVWLSTIDTPAVKYKNNGYLSRKSLWKRKVFMSSLSTIKVAKDCDYTSTIIYSESMKPTLILNQEKSAKSRIILYDILGRQLCLILDGILHDGVHRFTVPTYVEETSGVLFLHIEQPSATQIQKIVLKR